MKFDVEPRDINQAKIPHNLFMVNLALFHLLMTPAVIALDMDLWGVLLPLSLSLATMLFSYVRSRRTDRSNSFVFLHWKLALLRYRYLLIAYVVTGMLMLIGWMLAMGAADVHMQAILHTVFIRIAIMPVLLMVMVNFYLESSAISLASAGEVPDSVINIHAPELLQAAGIDPKKQGG